MHACALVCRHAYGLRVARVRLRYLLWCPRVRLFRASDLRACVRWAVSHMCAAQGAGKLVCMPYMRFSCGGKPYGCETSFSHMWPPACVREHVHVHGMCSLLFSKAGWPSLVLLSDFPFLGHHNECNLEFLGSIPYDWSRRDLNLCSQLTEFVLGFFSFHVWFLRLNFLSSVACIHIKRFSFKIRLWENLWLGQLEFFRLGNGSKGIHL